MELNSDGNDFEAARLRICSRTAVFYLQCCLHQILLTEGEHRHRISAFQYDNKMRRTVLTVKL